jgi:hypothetical protein
MELSLGKLIVICLTLIGVIALFTGKDGDLLRNIITFIAGMGTGATTELLSRRR